MHLQDLKDCIIKWLEFLNDEIRSEVIIINICITLNWPTLRLINKIVLEVLLPEELSMSCQNSLCLIHNLIFVVENNGFLISPKI